MDHHLFLTGDVEINAAITISASGSVTGPFSILHHGSLDNSGLIAVEFLDSQWPGSLINLGSIVATRHFAVKQLYSNQGTVNIADTLDVYSTDWMQNDGEIIAARARIGPQVYNNASIHVAQLSFALMNNAGQIVCDRCTPTGFLQNAGIIHAHFLRGWTTNIENAAEGLLTSDSLISMGDIDNYGTLRVFEVFLNGTDTSNGDLQLFAGSTTEARNFINHAGSRIVGPGVLCIAEHSENHGDVYGPIYICDVTPSSSTPPFMDIHDGGLFLPVYGCGINTCATVGIAVAPAVDDVTISPQPATEFVMIDWGSLSQQVTRLDLIDQHGCIVRSITGRVAERTVIDRSGIAPGMYSIRAFDCNGNELMIRRVLFGN